MYRNVESISVSGNLCIWGAKNMESAIKLKHAWINNVDVGDSIQRSGDWEVT